MVYTRREPLPILSVDENGDPLPPPGVDPDSNREATQLQIKEALTATVSYVPLTAPTFFEGVVMTADSSIECEPVAITSSSPSTEVAADADEVIGVLAWEMSFSGGTYPVTLTVQGGAKDFVQKIAAAGTYSLTYRGLVYCQTALNEALTLTVSDTDCDVDGMLYYAKGQ